MGSIDTNVRRAALTALRILQEELSGRSPTNEAPSCPQLAKAIKVLEDDHVAEQPIVVWVEGGAVSRVYAPDDTKVLVVDCDQHNHESAEPIPMEDGVSAMALVYEPDVDPMTDELSNVVSAQMTALQHDTRTASLAF